MDEDRTEATDRAEKGRRARLSAVALWLVPALLLAVVTIAAVRVARPESGADRLDRLFPLDPGTTWTYDTTVNGKPSGRHVVQVLGDALLADVTGQPSAAFIDSRWENYLGQGSPYDEQIYEAEVGGRFLDYGSRSHGRFQATTPPQLLYRLPLSRGSSWTWKGTSRGSAERTKGRVLESAKVSVGGKTLRDCLRIRTRTFFDDASGKEAEDVTDEWDCPGIGTVKTHETVAAFDFVLDQELVAFRGAGGRSFGPPGAIGETRATEEIGGTVGVSSSRANDVPDASPDLSHLAWSEDRTNSIDFPPIGRQGLEILAEPDGTVTARDTTSGTVLWRVRVAGPVVAPPVLSGSHVLIAPADKSLDDFDATSGSLRWSASFDDVVSTAPVVHADRVVVVDDDQTIRALRLSDGSRVWSTGTPGQIHTPPALAGDDVVVADEEGDVAAYSVADGSTTWSRTLSGLLGSGPAAAGGMVFLGDDKGSVYGLDAGDGSLRWNRFVGPSVEQPFAVADGSLVFIAGARRVEALDASDGASRWSARLDDDAAGGPLILGPTVLVATEGSTLHRLALHDGSDQSPVRLRPPNPSEPISVRLGPTFFGGNVIVSVRVEPPWDLTRILAFPAAPSAPRSEHGAAFTGRAFRISPPVTPSGPYATPRISGRDLFFPGWDDTVWRLSPSGAPRPLTHSAAHVPFSIPAGHVVLTQIGSDLLAIPPDGGKPLWHFAMGDPSPGQAPAVIRGTVVVPVSGQGLVGLDLDTGHPTWVHPIPDAQGVSTPLALAGGGVAYSAGGITVLDARTGTERWALPGFAGFAPMAQSDGVLVAGLVDIKGNRGILAAFDARTGDLLWVKPYDTPVFVGPAAGGGVAVAIDANGAVTGYDLRTGDELWSAQLRTSPAGPPVIVGDRVAVAEKGRLEDLNQRDFEVVVHDLRTGRYLGSFEPPGAAPEVPAFGGSNGRLLVFGSGFLFSLGVGEP